MYKLKKSETGHCQKICQCFLFLSILCFSSDTFVMINYWSILPSIKDATATITPNRTFPILMCFWFLAQIQKSFLRKPGGPRMLRVVKTDEPVRWDLGFIGCNMSREGTEREWFQVLSLSLFQSHENSFTNSKNGFCYKTWHQDTGVPSYQREQYHTLGPWNQPNQSVPQDDETFRMKKPNQKHHAVFHFFHSNYLK